MIRRLAVGFGPAVAVALLLFFYRDVLFAGQQFGYRDAAHYYYPLYQRVQAEWHAGRVPLWDEHENGGVPLLGNPTAAVLYPGKLIYAAFSYAWATRLYAVAHSALAFAGMWFLLRGWGASRPARALAGLAYAFGAPILIQYCNIIFLVGAAWLPWGVLAVDRWLRLGRRGAIPALAVVLAMQVLGGDPETAYVLGVAAGGYAFLIARDRRLAADAPARARVGAGGRWARLALVGLGLATWSAAIVGLAAVLPGFRPRPGEGPWEPVTRWLATGRLPQFVQPQGPVASLAWVPWLPRVAAAAWLGFGLILLLRWRRGGSRRAPVVPMLAGLAASAVLAGCLAGAQLLPVQEFTAISARATDEGPHDIYPFSLEPYRLIELVWPGFFGRTFGSSVSWSSHVLPKIDHHIWVPSLYVGALTLILACAAVGGRGPAETPSTAGPMGMASPGAAGGGAGEPWRAWMIAVGGVALLGSLGTFAGPLWAARFVSALAERIGPHDGIAPNAVRLDGYLRDGAGSPYSVLAATLPLFNSFRYPSKLLTFSCLALAALAGLGWDRVVAGRRRVAERASATLAVAGVLGLAGTFLGRAAIADWFDRQKIGSLFGPLDTGEALRDLYLATGQGAAVALGGWALIRLARGRADLAGLGAVALLALDLAWANQSVVRAIPQADLEAVPGVWAKIQAAEERDPSPGPFRVHRMPIWSPLAWRDAASPDRVRDFARWEQDTLQPKYGLPWGVDYTKTIGVAELYDFEWFFAPFPRRATPEAARGLGLAPGEEVVVYPRRGFDLWNTRYFVLPFIPRWDDPDRGIAAFLPNTTEIDPPPGSFRGPEGPRASERWARAQDYQIRRNEDMFPRAWVVHRARFSEPITGLDRRSRREVMEEILFKNDPFWASAERQVFDPRRLAWVETDDRAGLARFAPGMDPTPRESVAVVEHGPTRVVLDARLDYPGLVVLADVLYPGWTLTIDDQPAPIHRANRLMRGAAVEAGRHRLVYTYRPRSFRVGLILSGLGLLALLGSVVALARSPRGATAG